jgi:hypothetical protein
MTPSSRRFSRVREFADGDWSAAFGVGRCVESMEMLTGLPPPAFESRSSALNNRPAPISKSEALRIKSSADSSPGRQTQWSCHLALCHRHSGANRCGVRRQYKVRIEHSSECSLVPTGTAPTVPAFSSHLNRPIEQTPVVPRPLFVRMLELHIPGLIPPYGEPGCRHKRTSY